VSETLSPALRQLLDRCIDSFEKLELVMALARAVDRTSTVRDLARTIGVDPGDARTMVADLVACGIVTAEEGRVKLDAGPREEAVAELERVYDTDRMTLVKAIAEAAMDRLRNLAGRAFADAFVIRKKPGGEK
jgi:DNA-binding IclR family transcriptional regulator